MHAMGLVILVFVVWRRGDIGAQMSEHVAFWVQRLEDRILGHDKGRITIFDP